MAAEALSYVTQQTEAHQNTTRSACHARAIKQSTASQEYDIKVLMSEPSDSGRQYALITYQNNIYSLVDFSSTKLSPSEATPSTLTVKEMVQQIKGTFGLNNVQISDIIGVSRPSLYNHITDKESPKSLEPYQAFYNLALKVEAEITTPLKPGLKSILVDGKTLLAHLKDKNTDQERILHAAREVSKKLAKSKASNTITSEAQRRTSRSFTTAG